MKWFLFAVAPLVLAARARLRPGRRGRPRAALGADRGARRRSPIAVLRYRLDGIDVVINRTLVYALLTAVVIAVYVLVVGYLGAALRREDDLLISLVATGVVAVLFAPLRDRLQRAVDRLLYGQRAEPYAALSRLGRAAGGHAGPGRGAAGDRHHRARGAAAAVRRDRARRRASRWSSPATPVPGGGPPAAALPLRAGRRARPRPAARARTGSPPPTAGCSPTSPARPGSRCPPSGSPPTCSAPANGWSPPGRRNGGGCAATCTTGSARSWPG